jgi:predicted nucleic acid-binding protein
VAWLADTDVLVYRFDHRFPDKRERAERLLREGIASGEARISSQSVVEFVSAVTRPGRSGSAPILAIADAVREAERLLNEFTVLYPEDAHLRLALRGTVTYQLSWFDALMWACAEHNGLEVLYSEDFQHAEVIGHVRFENPFIG